MWIKGKIGWILALFFLLSFPTAVFAQEGLSIDSPSSLFQFRDAVNGGNSYAGEIVTLTADIDLGGVDWTAIGTEANPFAGTFDGAGKKITGLAVSGETGAQYNGLFGYNTGTVKNLSVTAADGGINLYNAKMHNFGGLIAAYNAGNIYDCAAAGSLALRNDRSYACGGGICGYNAGSISGAKNKAAVSVENQASWEYLYADAYAGGVCGVNAGSVTASTSDGAIKAGTRFASAAAGSIVGDNRGIISNCAGSGEIEAYLHFSTSMSYAYAGGICGSNTGEITGSDANSITVQSWLEAGEDLKRYIHCDAGGVTGYNCGTVQTCMAAGNVLAGIYNNSYGRSYAGGAVGYNIGRIIDTDTNVGVKGTTHYSSQKLSPDYLGGIVGYNEGGLISGCSAQNTLTTYEENNRVKWMGGIAGKNEGGYISLSSAKTRLAGDVSEQIYGGGLAGENSGVFENCYYIGTSAKAGTVGGLTAVNTGSLVNCYTKTIILSSVLKKDGIAADNRGAVRNCFYTVPNVQETIAGTQKTAEELKMPDTYAKWPFSAYWAVDSAINSGYPYIREKENSLVFSGGDGSAETPFLITTEAELSQIRYQPAAHYRLMSDISLTENWIPIGNCPGNAFRGTLDGNGYTIQNLRINGAETQYNALIGCGQDCGIYNLRVETGGDGIQAENTQENESVYVGGILAFGRNTTLENCVFLGKITGTGALIFAGGIAGEAEGSITGCRGGGVLAVNTKGQYTACTAGGVAGNMEGKISACYADMELTVKTDGTDLLPTVVTGGIAGRMLGDIQDTCFAGAVRFAARGSGVYHGGIAGTISGSIWNSYTDYAMHAGKMAYGPVTAQLMQGRAENVYYNEEIADGNGIGSGRNDFFTAEFLSACRDGGREQKYIWVKSAQTGRAEPLYVDMSWKIENGFTKCVLRANTEDAKIYFTRDGTDPRENGILYTGPFLCSPMNTVQYCVQSGTRISQPMGLIANPQSKYPVQMVALPKNQNQEPVSSENITQTESMTAELLSETGIKARIILAVYDGAGRMEFANTVSQPLIAGVNTVVFHDLQITGGTKIQIFIWDGDTMIPCSEAVRL